MRKRVSLEICPQRLAVFKAMERPETALQIGQLLAAKNKYGEAQASFEKVLALAEEWFDRIIGARFKTSRGQSRPR